MNGIPWACVQRMMIDAPSYDVGSDDDDIRLTEENGEAILNYVNSLM